MNIYKEIEYKNPLYTATLDNDVVICVFDGYAEGSDGKIYRPVVKDVDDGDCEFVGWTPEE